MSLLPDDYYVPQPKKTQPTSSVGSVQPWSQNTTPATIAQPDQPDKWGKWKNTLRWSGKQLMKPIGVVASLTEGIGTSIGRGETAPLGQALKKSGNVILGKEENSFSEIWQRELPKIIQPEGPTTSVSKNFAVDFTSILAGTTVDIAADPLNFIGGGGKKVLTTIQKGLGKIPGSQKLTSLFSTSTGNKAVDTFTDKLKSLGKYREAQIIEEARNIQKTVSALPEGEMIKVSNYLEKGTKYTPEINALGEKMKSVYDNMKTIEKGLGIKGAEIENYVPHIKIKDPLKERVKRFFNSPEWSNSLRGAEKERKILKFVSEEGDDAISTAENLGLKKINTPKLIEQTETATAKKVNTLQEIQKILAKPELQRGTVDLRSLIADLRKQVASDKNIIKIDLADPTAKEFQETIQSILEPERQRLQLIISDLEKEVLSSGGKEFLSQPLTEAGKASRAAKIVNIEKKITELQNLTAERIKKLQYFDYIGKDGKYYKAKTAPIEDITAAFQKKFFEENPAIQFAQRGLAHVKAVTSQEFFNGIKQFAKPEGVETGIKALEGLKFDPKVAAKVGEYYKSIQPEELKLIFRAFDNVQNWWKGQVLIAPSYHIRNMAGNIWNNFLAGVIDPNSYKAAGQLQMGLGKDIKIAGMSGDDILKLAKERGVINQGWYGADIPQAIESGIKSTWKQGINPLSQENYLFKANKTIGSTFENNARLAHFIDKLKKGVSVDDAVMSVKKYLFDYGDLTDFEKTVMKRIMPFYTWTRKNIPLQLEHLITQPGKFSGLEKVVRAVEDIGMGNSDPANEKYLSQYIQNNTAMRVKYDEKNKTYYYFLLGNWLPSYQAFDFLDNPIYNMGAMLNPFIKGYIDLKSNKSQFFENTLGESEVIEKYPGDTVNYLGLNMPKRTAYVLRNIRVLNELDKLNPGMIFGGKEGEPSKVNLPNFTLPGAGTFTPAQQKYGTFSTQPTGWSKYLNLFTGKLQPYKEETSQSMYNADTKERIDEYKQEIRGAYLKNDVQRAEQKVKEMQDFIKERTEEKKPTSFNFGIKEAKAASNQKITNTPSSLGQNRIIKSKPEYNGIGINPNNTNVISGIDLSKYASDPQHENKVARIYKSMPEFVRANDIDIYIKSKFKKSSVTGEMVLQAANEYGIDPKLLVAIMQQDSGIGTVGKGARNFNPGNVATYGNKQFAYKNWAEGVRGTARALDRFRVKSMFELTKE